MRGTNGLDTCSVSTANCTMCQCIIDSRNTCMLDIRSINIACLPPYPSNGCTSQTATSFSDQACFSSTFSPSTVTTTETVFCSSSSASSYSSEMYNRSVDTNITSQTSPFDTSYLNSCACTSNLGSPSITTITVMKSRPISSPDKSTVLHACSPNTTPSCNSFSADSLTILSIAVIASLMLIIAILVMTLLMVCACKKIKRQDSYFCDRNMAHINEPAGGKSMEVSNVQQSEADVKPEMSFNQQNPDPDDQTYDCADPDICLQHTYAALERLPLDKETHRLQSCSKQGLLENNTTAFSLAPTCNHQNENESALASDYMDPVSTLRGLVAQNRNDEAVNNHSLEHDQYDYLEHAQVGSQNSELVCTLKLDSMTNRVTGDHEYANLGTTTI